MSGQSRIGEAVDDLNAALALASVLGMRVEMAHCHAALAVSRTDEAAGHLEAARRMYAELGMTDWLDRFLGRSKSIESLVF